ncbi:L-fuconate dehydratase [Aureococcus anophagefferens]|nr:L-fuconate dehydratase [Aureococcus anophagefferens]
MKIVALDVVDWRYPTSLNSDGSDAVHKDPDYSCVYVTLRTDGALDGYGLTFTLGRGNEVVATCCESLAPLVVGLDLEQDVLGDLVAFQRRLTQDGQLRWIGPEKGALAMACGAVLNAAWDLAARRAGLPLWEFVASLEPEALVDMIDLKHLSDVVTKDAALAFLKKKRPGWQKRVAEMKRDGYPAYTTSAGWLGYPEAKVRALCREYVAAGHRYFKMKVGSPDPADDVMRARAIREEIGDDRVLMMDANQKWDVPEAIANMRQLAAFRPLWIEEPTHCDDVVGHREIARALRPLGVGVATGEVAQNKVIFKQLLQEDAIEFCQIDSCRIAGPSEIFAVLLMAAMKNVKVCPHAGGVGLCEYVRHLSMIDYVCFSGDLEGRVCESTTHLHEFFEDPVAFAPGPDGAVRYVAPKAPGFAKFEAKSAGAWAFPRGDSWRDAAAVGEKLHARARAAARAEGDKAAAVSEDTLAEIDPRAVYVLQAKCVSVLSRAAAASKKRKAPP